MIAGESQPPAVHALAPRDQRGARRRRHDRHLHRRPPRRRSRGEDAALAALVGEMRGRRRSSVLVVLGGEPGLRRARRPRLRGGARQGAAARSTSASTSTRPPSAATGTCPASHPLESWSDLRAADGTVSHRAAADRAALRHALRARAARRLRASGPTQKGYDIVREHWQAQLGEADFEKRWNRALHDGVVAGTALPAEGGRRSRPGGVGARAEAAGRGRARDRLPRRPERLRRPLREPRLAAGAAEAAHQAHLGQRRHREPEARRAARRHPRRRRRRRATRPTSSSCSIGGRSVKAPVWILPGHADDAVTVHLGYGRTRAGPRRHRRRLQRQHAPHERRALVRLRARGREDRRDARSLACTQDHWTIEQPPSTSRRRSGTSSAR